MDKATGYGEYTDTQGNVYKGSWNNDNQDGYGEEYWTNGSFKGVYENGQKVRGRFEWNDGSWYEGEIKEGERNGKGVMRWRDGRVEEGEWRKGRRVEFEEMLL